LKSPAAILDLVCLYDFYCTPIFHHWFPSLGLRQLRNKAISRPLPILFLLSPLSFPCSARFNPYIFAYIRNSWLLLCSGIVCNRCWKHTRLLWKTILTLTLNCLWIKLSCYSDIRFNYSIRSYFENQYPIAAGRISMSFSPVMYKTDTEFLKYIVLYGTIDISVKEMRILQLYEPRYEEWKTILILLWQETNIHHGKVI
jgi:hypothetical protein